MDPKKKFFLFKKSENFCAVPWNYFKINADGSVRTCVKGREILGDVNFQSIETILQNPVLQEIKRALYQDQLPANCVGCRQMDNNQGHRYSYLKDMYNDWFVSNPVDYSDPSEFHLSGIDLHWGNTCNLKCVTCWAPQSSSIAQEMRIPIKTVSKEHMDRLISWCLSRQSGLRELYFSGGEPTLIKHNVTLLEGLEARPDLLIRVNSNLTFDYDNRFVQQLKRFPNVLMTMSADSMEERFDYIRSGAQWSAFLDRVAYCQDQGWNLRVNSVFFVASALTLIDTQDFFQQKFGINDFTINQCEMEQHSLLCRNLPDSVKDRVKTILETALDGSSNNNMHGQILNCLKELVKDPNGHDYRRYFDQLDHRRGTDWRAVFTELT